MKKHLFGTVLILNLFLLFQTPAFSQDDIRIAWDYSSMQQLAERGGYPRLTRLKDSTLVVIYETRRGSVHLKKSIDNGKTWSAPVEVFSQFVYTALDGKSTIVNIANPEIIQLKNGDIVIGCNYRPAKAEIAPYSIVIRRSTDNGKTWLPPQSLYSAAPRFHDGCWEPAFLQLPNGELQVYFANENPYRNSNEQEISMMSSNDNGASWTEEVTTVSFRKDRRDGMPVPTILGDEIVVAIEDNKIGQFKPYTVRSPLSENWRAPVLATSEKRDYALSKPVNDTVYMGAPYLLRLPNGYTLLSYQTNENRAHDWELSTMEVAVGDQQAKNFGKRTRPFDVPQNKEAKWNSLSVWDKNTVAALASSDFKSPQVAPWLIKGYIIPQIRLRSSRIEDYPIFIGSQGNNHLRAGLTLTHDTLHINCRISERESTTGVDAGVFLYLNLNKQTYKLWVPKTGQSIMYVRKNGKWKASNLQNKFSVKVSAMASGYEISYHVLPTLWKNLPAANFSLSIALSTDTAGNKYVEHLVNTREDDPSTWIKILQ